MSTKKARIVAGALNVTGWGGSVLAFAYLATQFIGAHTGA